MPESGDDSLPPAYNMLLNQDLPGVFTHEAFDHFSEADLIEDSPSMREKMQIGARLGSESVSIVDDPTISGQMGFYRYDDEAVAGRHVVLMDHGILTGRLHSRRSSAAFGESLTGHCVAEDYRYAPMVRMGNIFIEPGRNSLGELIEMLGNGLLSWMQMAVRQAERISPSERNTAISSKTGQ